MDIKNTSESLGGFPFGQHFVCECCGERMPVAHKGVRMPNGCFLLPLSVEPQVWKETYDHLLATGAKEASLCGKCGCCEAAD